MIKPAGESVSDFLRRTDGTESVIAEIDLTQERLMTEEQREQIDVTVPGEPPQTVPGGLIDGVQAGKWVEAVSPQRHRYARPAELVEILAAKSHEGYLLGKRATGTESRRSESGEEVMVPFEQLSEASKDISRAAAAAMLDGLQHLGVPITSLVKIMVDAETDLPLIQELEQGKPEPVPVNTCETDADAAHRFAGQVGEAREQLERAWGLIANVSGGNWDQQTAEWQQAAAAWRDRWLATPA